MPHLSRSRLSPLASPRYTAHSLRGDVLLNLAALDGVFFKLLRLAFGLSVCCTYPTMHYVVRRSIDQMLFHSSEGVPQAIRLHLSPIALALPPPHPHLPPSPSP